VGAGRRVPIVLQPDDVVPTGNQWISLPDIHSVDGAVSTLNVISMRTRGLLRVMGQNGGRVLEPYFMARSRLLAFRNPSKVLRASGWDGGIVTEGVGADSGRMDQQGRAFATAAGYVAHAICNLACNDR
jgi:hypothetical protein